MAYLTLIRISGDPDEVFEESKQLDEVIGPVATANGGISHVVAKTDDGILIVNVWESKEGSEATANDPKVREATSSSGGRNPTFEHYDDVRHVTR